MKQVHDLRCERRDGAFTCDVLTLNGKEETQVNEVRAPNDGLAHLPQSNQVVGNFDKPRTCEIKDEEGDKVLLCKDEA